MKIALVSQEYPPETAHGGIGTQIFMRAHGLFELGHTVYVISHSVDYFKHENFDNGVHIMRIPGFNLALPPYTEASTWLSYSTEVAIAVRALHEEINLDLVVFPEYGGEGFIHLLNQTSYYHIPSIVHIHGPLVMFANTMAWPDINSEFYKVGAMMESTSLRLADGISASNRCSASWCAEHYGIDGSKIPILYSGIDTSLFYPRNLPKEKRPTVIFVGGIRATKGVNILVQAACILLKDFPDLQVRLVGKGEESFIAELKQQAADADSPGLLDFVGQVTREDLPDYLSRAHFFAGPSFYEGGPGNVYLEAMGCGIPAIGCSGSGVDGIIINQKNGFLVPPNNVEALASTMKILIANPKLCESMGRNGREYVLEEADSKTCIKKLEVFYKEVSQKHYQNKIELRNLTNEPDIGT